MLVAKNRRLKQDLKKLVSSFSEDTHNFGCYLIIYDFLEYLDKTLKLQKIMEKLKKESQVLQKSVSINNGILFKFHGKLLNFYHFDFKCSLENNFSK